MGAKTRKLKRKSKVKRRKDSLPLKYCVLTVICGLLLVAGFFFAARQHFASVDYGMKNAKLRKQIDELNAEKRRLQLSKEIALSPGEIKKAAQKMGFTTMTASNIEVIKPKSVSSEILEDAKENDDSIDEKDSKSAEEKKDIPEIKMSKKIKDEVKKDLEKKDKKGDKKEKINKKGKTKKAESKKKVDKKEKTDKKLQSRKSRTQLARK